MILHIAFSILASKTAAHQPTGKQAQTIALILARDNQYTDGLLNKNIPELRALLADSFSDTAPTGQKRTKDQFLAATQNAPKLESIAIDDRHVRVRGPKAVVTATYTVHGISGGTGFIESGLSTEIWINQKGQWYCVSTSARQIFHGSRL